MIWLFLGWYTAAGVSREWMDQLWQFGCGSQGGGWRSKMWNQEQQCCLGGSGWKLRTYMLSTFKGLKMICFFFNINHCRFGSNCFLESSLFVFVPFFDFEGAQFSWTFFWQERLWSPSSNAWRWRAGRMPLGFHLQGWWPGGNESWGVSPTSVVYIEYRAFMFQAKFTKVYSR